MNAQQLKNAILQEAIEGRLVSQDPNDEPASILLEKICKEKERLVKDGKLKKKELEVKPISEDEIPFEIPESWEWVRINDLGEIITGGTPSKQNEDYYGKEYPFYKPGDLDKGIDICDSVDGLSQKGYDASRKIKANSVLVTCIGATIGKTGLISKDGACNQQINAIISVNSLLPKYVYYTICSPTLQSIIRKDAGQTTLPIMNKNTFCKLLFPLPPLAEQKRIVAKIEELLPKVEKYGKAQDELNKLNEELPERLKKSILQEAIEGRLVLQDPSDEPASVLLQKIREEKLQLVKEGKLKKKDLEEKPISEDEIPFEIPDTWEWCRLGDIGLFERGNGIKRDETFERGYPCVRYGEMYTKYKYAPTFEKTVSFTNKSVFEKCRKAHKGDLFMALTGENKQDISLAAQYVGDEEIAVGGDLCHFTILEAYGLYFVYLINSTYFSSKKEILATGDIIVHISTDKLASIPIPLPPLAEQKRIVAKVEQLLGEIDKLKK